MLVLLVLVLLHNDRDAARLPDTSTRPAAATASATKTSSPSRPSSSLGDPVVTTILALLPIPRCSSPGPSPPCISSTVWRIRRTRPLARVGGDRVPTFSQHFINPDAAATTRLERLERLEGV